MSSDSPFKRATSFADRCRRFQRACEKDPNKLPVVIERHRGEEGLGLELPLPDIVTMMLLVPRDVYVSDLIALIRSQLGMGSTQTLFLLDGRGRTVCASSLVSRVYEQQRDEDGFLYMSLASRSHIRLWMARWRSRFTPQRRLDGIV